MPETSPFQEDTALADTETPPVLDSAAWRPDRVGTLPVSEVVSSDGIDLFRRMMAGDAPAPPIGAVMNMSVAAAEVGEVTFASVPDASLLNPIGSVHGGYALTLLDSCMSCAVHTTLKAGQAYTTVEVKVNFTRAIQPGITTLRATGKVLTAGRRIATAEGRVVGDDGKLYAHGTTTCLVFEPGKA